MSFFSKLFGFNDIPLVDNIGDMYHSIKNTYYGGTFDPIIDDMTWSRPYTYSFGEVYNSHGISIYQRSEGHGLIAETGVKFKDLMISSNLTVSFHDVVVYNWYYHEYKCKDNGPWREAFRMQIAEFQKQFNLCINDIDKLEKEYNERKLQYAREQKQRECKAAIDKLNNIYKEDTNGSEYIRG